MKNRDRQRGYRYSISEKEEYVFIFGELSRFKGANKLRKDPPTLKLIAFHKKKFVLYGTDFIEIVET